MYVIHSTIKGHVTKTQHGWIKKKKAWSRAKETKHKRIIYIISFTRSSGTGSTNLGYRNQSRGYLWARGNWVRRGKRNFLRWGKYFLSYVRNGYLVIHSCQSSLHWAFKICKFYCTKIITKSSLAHNTVGEKMHVGDQRPKWCKMPESQVLSLTWSHHAAGQLMLFCTACSMYLELATYLLFSFLIIFSLPSKILHSKYLYIFSWLTDH